MRKKILFGTLSATLGMVAIYCAQKKEGPSSQTSESNANIAVNTQIPMDAGCEYSENPDVEYCQDCGLTLICLSPRPSGEMYAYEGLDEEGNKVTSFPHKVCGEEVYWSCPGITSSPDSTYSLISFPPLQALCPVTSITNSGPLLWPTYLITKNTNAFDKFAEGACQRARDRGGVELSDEYFSYGVFSKNDLKNIDISALPPQILNELRNKFGGGVGWNTDVVHQIIATDKPLIGDLPFNRLVAFGDSISDNGNRYTIYPHPYFPYFFKRYSNGPVWVEYISKKFKGTTNQIDLMDLAWAGAAIIPGMGDQNNTLMNQVEYSINLFNPKNQPYISKITNANTIYSLMAGMIDGRDMIEDYWLNNGGWNNDRNIWYGGHLKLCWDNPADFPGYDADIKIIADKCVNKLLLDKQHSTRAAAVKLINNGAKYFIIPELPDYRLLIRYNGSKDLPNVVNNFIEAFVNKYNDVLKNKLIPELESSYGAQVVRLDLHSMYQSLADSDSLMAKGAGITNITVPGMDSYSYIPPESSLYWDDVHPSASANCVISERAYELIFQKFSNKTYTPDYTLCHQSMIHPGSRIFKTYPKNPDKFI